MKTLILCSTLVAFAAAGEEPEDVGVDMVIRGDTEQPQAILHGSPVDRVSVDALQNWRVIDARRFIVYQTRSRPYLITLAHRAPALNHTPFLGFRTRSQWLEARFDDVYIDQRPYRIERIEKLTPEVAAALLDEDDAQS